MMPDMDTLAARFAYARKLRKMSYEEVTAAMGDVVKWQSLQAIETKGGGSKHLNAIAKALRVRLDWLERGEEPMEAEEERGNEPPPQILNPQRMRLTIITAEMFWKSRNESPSPVDKANSILKLYDIVNAADDPSKIDPAKYPNVFELFAKR